MGLKKFKVSYKVDGIVLEDIWHAESAREARRCALDDYRTEYGHGNVTIVKVELLT